MPIQFFTLSGAWKRRLKSVLLTVPLALLIYACSPLSTSQGQQRPEGALLAETGRVYALVSSQTAAGRLQASARDLGYTPQSVTRLAGLGFLMIAIDLPQGVTGATAIENLEAAVPGSTVGVNHAYRLQVSQETSGRKAFANDLMNWPTSGCRAATPIGLIDGGLDAAAPALAGVKLRSRSFAKGSAAAQRHGTEVASVLANPGRLQGVSLVSADVIATTESGEDLAGAAAMVQAIDWLTQQGVRLVNISLAGPPNKLLAQAIEASSKRGVLLVAAAGNNGRTAPVQFPAAHPAVIAVTAVDAQSRIYRNAVRGAQVDVAAPGVDVFVGSDEGGRYVSGTSMAAPFVTARLAAQTGRSKAVLIDGALDLGPAGKDNIFGHGLIQGPAKCG